jgi:CRISPR/Cas system CSM-associated protein Csm4 (group 5 of RAMP superfamily)
MIPVIIARATGTTSKPFRKYLSNIKEKHKIKDLQKTTIVSAAHTIWEALFYTYKTFGIRNNITRTINCNYRTAATLYTIET